MPKSYLDIGTVPFKEDMADWTIDTSFTPYLDPKPPTFRYEEVGNTCFGKTVASFVQNIFDSPPWMLTQADVQALRAIGDAPSITGMIIQGKKQAGMYDTLTKVDGNGKPSFTIHDLRTKGHLIDNQTEAGIVGLYFRYYETGKLTKWWPPLTKFIYVGQSNDISRRGQNYRNDLNNPNREDHPKHIALTQQASKQEMRLLCVLPNSYRILHLVEQILVCLLQTYRKPVFDMTPGSQGAQDIVQSTDKSEYMETVRTARFFDDLMTKIGEKMGWTGGTKRFGFGVSHGVNGSSPLAEFRTNQTLFVRNDFWMMDEASGEPLEISNFRRANMARLVVRSEANNIRNIGIPLGSMINVTAVCDSKHCPAENTEYQAVIEVRKDWKPHPKSFARLAQIGPYENWDRANSWAIKIQWEQPKGSKKFRELYLEHGVPNKRMKSDIPGSFIGYGAGIRVIHWLYREPSDYLQ